jgi:hypothetical protein
MDVSNAEKTPDTHAEAAENSEPSVIERPFNSEATRSGTSEATRSGLVGVLLACHMSLQLNINLNSMKNHVQS